MAESRPCSTAWYRNAEFSALRAAGCRPKLTLLRPSVVKESGNSPFTARRPSRVLLPASANSASPVPSVKVSTSNTYCPPRSPSSSPAPRSSRAVASFCAGVFAMPSGPMHSATAGTPYFFMTGASLENLLPSPSKFIEFIMGRPGVRRTASSTTAGSVESMTSGASTSRLSRFTSEAIISSSSDRSVVATHTSRQCAPPSTWSLAMSTSPSMSPSRTRRLALREPCALSRSPISMGGGSWRSATEPSAELMNSNVRAARAVLVNT